MILPALPDDAHVWLYLADRPLSDEDERALLDGLRRFFASWHSHRVPVEGDAAVLGGRVLVVGAAMGPGEDLSGCGIDQHAREVTRLAAARGFGWHDSLTLGLRSAPHAPVEALPRAAVRAALRGGDLPPDVQVLDAAPGSLGDLRASGGFVPLARSPFAAWATPS